MMIPERLGTAAMTIGAARPALEIATRYSSRRTAFGQPIRGFQGVSFQVAEAVTARMAGNQKSRVGIALAQPLLKQGCHEILPPPYFPVFL